MNTSDAGGARLPDGLTLAPSPGAAAGAQGEGTFAAELARLANQVLAQLPGAAMPGGAPLPAAAPVSPSLGFAPQPVAPPHLGPSALDVGGGGVSGGQSLPPFPGFMHAPPIASAPPPKESDLRSVPAIFSESLGLSSPLVLARAAPSDAGSPPAAAFYFLDVAGPPAAAPLSSPSAPPLSSTTRPASAPSLPSATQPAAAATPSAGIASAPFNPELVPDLSAPGGAFDPLSIRRDFPILNERVHGGRRLIWLDNAATTQKPNAVIDRLTYFYHHENSNVHRAAHALAARATDAYEGARDKVRRFLNAPSSRDVIFTRGATEAINLVAQSWGRRNVGAGDEILITWLEHHANIVPWQQLCAEKNARLCVAPVDAHGQVILEEFERLLSPRTRLVSITQVSNALGTITPAREMVAMAHRHGATVLVDGAQAVSHMPVDVQALDCDFYCFSGHKVFAPTGIGVLFGKADVLQHMPPWQGGGNMIRDVTFEKTSYQPPPGRFEAGTGNIADAVGLGAAVDYVTAIGLESIARYEHELLVYATQALGRVPGLKMIGTAPDKAGVLSFVIDGVRTEDIGAALDQEGIAVRSGHHCAQPILRRFGLESTVRASLAPYNTTDDIDALCSALLRLQSIGARPAR
jgi:cysteine desulfurase/selenocysteine lyase